MPRGLSFVICKSKILMIVGRHAVEEEGPESECRLSDYCQCTERDNGIVGVGSARFKILSRMMSGLHGQ